MSFLAVFAAALSLASARLAQEWGAELAHTMTVRIAAPADQKMQQTDAALRVLQTTRGVADARALTNAEQTALLAPWFGPGLSLDNLPVPQLIEVTETPQRVDAEGLMLRLRAEVPGAVLDDHDRWRVPLQQSANRLRLLGWMSAGLITVALGAMVTLAARAALAANAQVIAVLRLVGARDDYIAGAFVRRFTLRAFFGALGGTTIAVSALFLFPHPQEAGLLTSLRFGGTGWMVPVMIPVLTCGVALVATRIAARRQLKELT
jgi:cell division transport system permease protein